MLAEAKPGQQSQTFPHKSEGVHVHYVVLVLVHVFRAGFFLLIFYLTPSLPRRLLKWAVKMRNLKPLSISFSFSHWHVKGKNFHQNA